ncbi:hypothetical protein SNEBB_005266 [Seison nebaliae]|nr:hypothetical protein SNEBB_005266 [Seison nebaliae]
MTKKEDIQLKEKKEMKISPEIIHQKKMDRFTNTTGIEMIDKEMNTSNQIEVIDRSINTNEEKREISTKQIMTELPLICGWNRQDLDSDLLRLINELPIDNEVDNSNNDGQLIRTMPSLKEDKRLIKKRKSQSLDLIRIKENKKVIIGESKRFNLSIIRRYYKLDIDELIRELNEMTNGNLLKKNEMLEQLSRFLPSNDEIRELLDTDLIHLSDMNDILMKKLISSVSYTKRRVEAFIFKYEYETRLNSIIPFFQHINEMIREICSSAKLQVSFQTLLKLLEKTTITNLNHSSTLQLLQLFNNNHSNKNIISQCVAHVLMEKHGKTVVSTNHQENFLPKTHEFVMRKFSTEFILEEWEWLQSVYEEYGTFYHSLNLHEVEGADKELSDFIARLLRTWRRLLGEMSRKMNEAEDLYHTLLEYLGENMERQKVSLLPPYHHASLEPVSIGTLLDSFANDISLHIRQESFKDLSEISEYERLRN